MSDNNKSDYESGYDDLIFDSEIRSILAKKLNKAITSQNQFLSAEDIHSKVNEVIDSIELISNSIGFYRKFKIDKQHRRKERLESIANHLDGIIDQLTALDQPAIIYALTTIWSDPPILIRLHPIKIGVTFYTPN